MFDFSIIVVILLYEEVTKTVLWNVCFNRLIIFIYLYFNRDHCSFLNNHVSMLC